VKVLLLQEMSGVHTNLASGLRELGVNVDLACNGDGFKRYNSDINLGSINGGFNSHLERAKKQIELSSNFDLYDVIQTISPSPFYTGLKYFLEQRLLKSRAKKIYIAAGSDSIYRNHVKELEYFPPHNWDEKVKGYNVFKSQLLRFDEVIPVCWEYEYAMKKAGINCQRIVPFPINLTEHQVVRNNSNAKIIVYHPLNRVNLNFDFKGTLLIEKAFELLRENYSDIADFISKGNMTHQEYNEFTNSVDIVVDQTYSYSYGMSGAIGLAKGQVVLSGQESVTKNSGHYVDSPVLNFKPEVQDIYNKIEKLIIDRKLIQDLSEKSRMFAEEYHCHIKVAAQYLDIYQSDNL